MKKLVLLIALQFCGFHLYSQNFSADMARVNNMYIHLNKNMVVSTTKMVDKQLVSSQQISMSIKGIDEFYMEDAQTEVLVRDGLKILVSRQDKVIIVDSNYLDNINQLPVSLFDTLQMAYKTIERTILSNGSIQYKLVPKSINSSIVIILEQNTNLIRKIRFETEPNSAKSQSLELKYAYTPLGEFPSVSNYIVKSSGKYQVSQQWSGFTLLNYLPKPN